MKTKLFCVIGAFLISAASIAQVRVLRYEIVRSGNQIGKLHVQQDRVGDDVHYYIEGNVKEKFLFEINVKYIFKNSLTNGVLTYGYSQNVVNDKEKEMSEIKWDGSKYQIFSKEEGELEQERKITLTLTNVYLTEPNDATEIYSERYCEFLKIEKMDEPHKYELHLPDGKTNEYTFENGVVKEVKINHFLTTFYFRLLKDEE
ncbi:DUF6134 family protein [Flammeovirgaceae bacterium SG7u.111]|nr:DUF6134 family protein [Flammeovirgaceae bacterium SG7u.132]WPO35049.1 DUF6134 family protein [Flammeovirgaceae bacterium SG7u.111]